MIHEKLGSACRSPLAYYGLRIDGQLMGCVCFAHGPSPLMRNVCGIDYRHRVVCLMRGCTVPGAPRNSGSYLVRHACEAAAVDFGWGVFYGYADPVFSSENGLLYRAAGWEYIGQGLGRRPGKRHLNWRSPDGKLITSFNRKLRDKKKMFALSFKPEVSFPKKVFIFFEDKSLAFRCKFPPVPFEKTAGRNGTRSIV